MDNELLLEYRDFLNKKKEEGKQIIAFLAHDNIPEELIHAAGFVPLRLIFAGNDELMNSSHDYLPPSTCSFAQSCIGLFSKMPSNFGFLELIDYIIVSNHCVSDICASEIISKYFFIPRINFYAPYTHATPSLRYFKEELVLFKKELESISDKISDESIVKSIKLYNELKLLLAQINDLELIGSEKLKIFQKALLYGTEIIPELKNLISERKKPVVDELHDSKSLIFMGCSIFLGDYLINLIEEGGGNIVLFDTWIGHGYYSQTFTEEELISINDPIDLLVKRFENNEYGDHTVTNFLINRLKLLDNFLKSPKMKNNGKVAVINHVIKFCDHINMFQSILKKELQDRGIPVLNLERDYSRANRGQLTTRIEAFLEMI